MDKKTKDYIIDRVLSLQNAKAKFYITSAEDIREGKKEAAINIINNRIDELSLLLSTSNSKCHYMEATTKGETGPYYSYWGYRNTHGLFAACLIDDGNGTWRRLEEEILIPVMCLYFL